MGKTIKRATSISYLIQGDYEDMKKTLFVVGLCVILLSMPTLVALPTQRPLQLFSPHKLSDGTFAGGMGHGHWGNGGFNIDSVYAYMHGVYTAGIYKKISGDLTNPYDEKIGEINAYIIYKIMIGYTQNTQGHRTSLIGILIRSQNDQFVGRIMGIVGPASHIWWEFIPNR